MSEYHDLMREYGRKVQEAGLELDRRARELRERCPHAESHWLADVDYVWLVCRNCFAKLRRGRERHSVEHYPVLDPERTDGE